MDWHPDGRRLAVGSQDGRIRLFDPTDPDRAPRILEGHDGQVVAVAFHPGGVLLASASWDGTLRLWDARTGQELVQGPLPEARPIRFSRDGRLLGPGQDVGASWLWEVAEGDECRSLVGPEGGGLRTWSVDFLGAGDVLVSAGVPGLRLEVPDPGWHADDGGDARDLGRGRRPRRVVADHERLAGTAPLAGPRCLLEGHSGSARREPLGPLAGVPTGRIRLGRDGRTLAAVVDDERREGPDLRSGRPRPAGRGWRATVTSNGSASAPTAAGWPPVPGAAPTSRSGTPATAR